MRSKTNARNPRRAEPSQLPFPSWKVPSLFKMDCMKSRPMVVRAGPGGGSALRMARTPADLSPYSVVKPPVVRLTSLTVSKSTMLREPSQYFMW